MPSFEKSTTFDPVSVALRARKTRLQKLHERSKWCTFRIRLRHDSLHTKKLFNLTALSAFTIFLCS